MNPVNRITSSLLCLTCLLLPSMITSMRHDGDFSALLQHAAPLSSPVALHRQGAGFSVQGSNMIDMIMYGLAGIPIYKAVGLLLPYLRFKKHEAKQNDRSGVNIHKRSKRDLSYVKDLLNLLISVENALEKYGITDPQCQLRATCEIHWKDANTVTSNSFERRFVKLVNEMRREIQNPRIEPLAKYVFEYYEEAAIRGEDNNNCAEMYPRCPHSLDYFYKRTKSRPKGYSG